jgi:hypothetical protein
MRLLAFAKAKVAVADGALLQIGSIAGLAKGIAAVVAHSVDKTIVALFIAAVAAFEKVVGAHHVKARVANRDAVFADKSSPLRLRRVGLRMTTI